MLHFTALVCARARSLIRAKPLDSQVHSISRFRGSRLCYENNRRRVYSVSMLSIRRIARFLGLFLGDGYVAEALRLARVNTYLSARDLLTRA